MERKIQNVAIVGAGLMGFGIGVEYARFGYNVTFHNTSKASSELAMERSRDALNTMVKNKLITQSEAKATLGRIRPTTDIADAAKGVDLVVESVLEDLPLKQDLFAKLDAICPPRVILCTNTSGLKVTDIASKAKSKERILATHYIQPPHFVPLVEVCPGDGTDPKLILFIADMLRKMRKMVVIIPRDSPRFIHNRIQGAIARECQTLVDEGLGTPEVIDTVITFGFGRRMRYTGYFKRIDLIGIDHTVLGAKARGIPVWKPFAEHADKGEYGMKTGKGFYDWPEEKQKAFLSWYENELIRMTQQDMERGDI